MARLNLTDITLVLDRSGSMQSVKQATIDAFNTFLRSQRSGIGFGRMTLVQFDDQYEVNYQGLPLIEAEELNATTYQPRASTALLDAMGRTILATRARLTALPEHDRPGTVLFVTLTDGQENASREFTVPRINQMIREYREEHGWQFVFLAATQDAIATAGAMGMGAAQSLTFELSMRGTAACLASLNKQVHKMRKRTFEGAAAEDFEFDEADRAAQHLPPDRK